MRKPRIWLLLVAGIAGIFTACRGSAEGEPGDLFPQLPHASARTPLQAAAIFAPGLISDERWQYRITFTPDGDTAYFTVADAFFPQSRRSTIYRSTQGPDGEWTKPVVASFSGTYTDIDPFVTLDGGRLYFSSIRPLNGVAKPGLDIFFVDRIAGGWSEPVRLGPEVNSELDELYVSMDANGTIYFGSGPPAPTPGANWNIFSARATPAGFEPRWLVSPVSTRRPWDAANPTQDWEFNPEISPDGTMLLFASLRPGGHGRGDIYVSHLDGEAWGEPVNLGFPVNTDADEFHPTLSRDGRTLYFARTLIEPRVVPGNFYSVPTSAIPALRR